MMSNPSKSQVEHYEDLLKERKDNPCKKEKAEKVTKDTDNATWTKSMKKLLDVKRSCGVGQSEALSFILREGFHCDFYTTPSGLVGIKRLDIHGKT